jgi:hypothetical protein
VWIKNIVEKIVHRPVNGEEIGQAAEVVLI